MTGDIGERVVQVLAPEDDEAKKTGQEEHKKPNEGFELAQAGLLLLLVVLVDFYGGVAAGADQTARVQNEDEQDEDEDRHVLPTSQKGVVKDIWCDKFCQV